MPDKFHFSPRENKAHEINWRQWDEAAFNEAKEKDKLILLGISAVWCHWCHVMDETSYSYKPNINLINDEFIPIRVDNDKRPDINKIYNMGGWPTTVVLTPQGEVLNGGTYMPEKTLYSFLSNANRYYKSNKNKLGENIEEVSQEPVEDYKGDNNISKEILKEIDLTIYKNFDSHFGGFGIEPKFFHADILDYLISAFYNKQDDKMFKIITKTLDSIATGGIYDQQEGGFFRYSTTRDWSIPHYEKMLEDNAKMLDIYLKVFNVTKTAKYSNTCQGIIDYLNNNLLNSQNGTFYGSQDADEHYYNLSKEKRKEMQAPYIDKTVYTDWNAMAICAYVRAYYTLDNTQCLDIAKRCANFLMTNCFDESNGMYHYYSDESHVKGLLNDQIYFINSLIDLYEVTSENRYLYFATELADYVLEHFYDNENAGFYDDIIENNFVPAIKYKEKSFDINSFCIQVFYRLYDYSTLEKYKDAAQKTLFLLYKSHQAHGFFAAQYGKSVLRYFYDPTKITIVGDTKVNKTIEMFTESLKLFIPFKIVELLDINKDRQRIEINGYGFEQKPLGYICIGQKCLSPVASINEINNQLSQNNYQ